MGERVFAADIGDPRILHIYTTIRVVNDFPKKGGIGNTVIIVVTLNKTDSYKQAVYSLRKDTCIPFQDITTLLLDHKAFKDTVDSLADRYRNMSISVVAGVEARGFIFGPSVALALNAKLIPLSKHGKLPGEVISQAYELEYGTDCLEMHTGAVDSGERAIIIDDVVVTEGTLSAAIKLIGHGMGAEVVECACVIGLREAKGQCTLGKPLYILMEPKYSE